MADDTSLEREALRALAEVHVNFARYLEDTVKRIAHGRAQLHQSGRIYEASRQRFVELYRRCIGTDEKLDFDQCLRRILLANN